MPNTIEIIPAILPRTFVELEETIARVHGSANMVQVDIVDGAFAANKTWPYGDAQQFENIIAGNAGLPLWEDFDFQFDLMCVHPEEEVERFVQAGASAIIIHAQSKGASAAFTALSFFNADKDELRTEVGVALLPSASPEVLDAFDGNFNFIQVMGIKRIGFQGEPFDEGALELIKELRAEYPAIPIQVDGGVSLKNVRTLVEAGATRLVVGSAVFAADNPKQALEALYTEANESH